ncbi:MAG: response regulator transcription factor [Terriglobales bacterium]
MPNILMVEDDRDLALIVGQWLRKQNYTLDICHDGLEGYEYARQGHYDAIILDWDLPGMSGLEICQRYRSNSGTTPILILTAKDQIADKERGLEQGADDYLCKPFHMRELAARLRALMRRPIGSAAGNVIKVGSLEMDIARHKFYKSGKEIHLNPKEYSLLEFLMRHPGEVFHAEAIIQRVWSMDSEITSESVRTVVARIRRKVDETEDESASIIENVRRIGYRLNAD